MHRRSVVSLFAVLLAAALAAAPVAAADTDGFEVRAEVAEVGDPQPDVEMHGSGFGHSVGMSQYGALAMARAGRTAGDILLHYYNAAEVALDERDTGARMRVGLRQGVPDTTVAAVGGDVRWDACSAAESERAGRVPDAACEDEVAVQPVDSTYLVCPTEDTGVRVFEDETGDDARLVCPPEEPADDVTDDPTDDPTDETDPTDDTGGTDSTDGTDGPVDGNDPQADPATVAASADTADAVGAADADAAEVTAAQTEVEAQEPVFVTDRAVVRVQHAGTEVEVPGRYGDRQVRGFHDIVRPKDGEAALNTVQDLPSFEDYLYGLFEMMPSWGTEESGGQAALRAQAISARTYGLPFQGSERASCSCDILATPAEQAYAGYDQEVGAGGAWKQAVDGTAGTVLEDSTGALVATYYSSSHGGATENSEDSWAYASSSPTLRSVDDPWSLEEANPFRAWTLTVPHDEVRSVVAPDLERITRLEIVSTTDGGTPKMLRVHGLDGETREFTQTREAARRARPCSASSRGQIAGSNLLCDLRGDVVDAKGRDATARLGGRAPAQQFGAFGFGPFADDDGGLHEYATVWAHEAGVASGLDAARFGPDKPVTRGQMATFIYQTFDIPEPTGTHFDDVEDGDTHAEAINALAEQEIVSGYDGDVYRSGDPVTRAQMATFLAATVGLDEVEPDGRFSDVDDGVHAGNVHAIVAAELARGCDADRYCPSASVQRGQMATFLRNAAVRAR